MNDKTKIEPELLLNGEPYNAGAKCSRGVGPRGRRRLLVGIILAEMCFVLPKYAHGQFLGVFDSIFSSIQSDIGSSLSSINQLCSRRRSSIRLRLRRWRP